MNKILVIENTESDFNNVRKIFSGWNILPDKHNEIDYNSNSKIVDSVKDAVQEKGISSIIIDISLQGDCDENGLEVIEKIRALKDVEFKIIPIYCYSRHGNTKSMIEKALRKGATNIFSKGRINNPQSDDIIFLQQSLTALSFIYSKSCGDVFDIKDVLNQMSDINDKLRSIDAIAKINLNAILQFSTFQDIDDLTTLNDTNRATIANAIGGEDALENLLKTRWLTQNKAQQEELINQVADILSNIPGLSPIAAILKGITLISKNAK